MDTSIIKNTLIETLEINFLTLTPEKVVATMPVGPKVYQPMGLLHGGASVALAETVATVGAVLNLDISRQTAVGQEINANHLRSVKSGLVTASGKAFYIGKRSQVWHIEIHDEQGKLICVSRCTLAIVDIAQS